MKSFRLVRHPAPGTRMATWRHLVAVTAIGVGLLVANPWAAPSGASPGFLTRWIVSDPSATSFTVVEQLVANIGGQLLEALPAANGVEASLTSVQSTALALIPGVVLTPDVSISLQSTSSPTSGATRAPSAVYAQQTGATQLWAKGDKGQGINVAVLDTGIDPLPDFQGRLVGGVDLTGEGNPFLDDYGHGTFVAGLIAGSGTSSGGQYVGEAPSAGLVSVKVAGANGETDLATVIEGVGWTISHASSLHIRVLNLSLGFTPFTSAYLNPLDLAVQTAWEDGIVVVVSAGNAGPFSGTIMSPGDDPYVITVGAVDDEGQSSPSNDAMAGFSSVGPTDPDGFYKPDLVTSGRSVVSLAAPGSTIYDDNPGAVVGSANFVGSGTSFSAAITSGAVALELQQHGGDAPDVVKARLLGSASPGPVGNPFVDGHGLLNVAAAATMGGVRLTQNFGAIALSGSMQGTLQVQPGDRLAAGYALTIPGAHPPTSVQLVQAAVSLPVSCTANGSVVGALTIPVIGGPFNIPQNGNSWYPTADSGAVASFLGSNAAADLCGGGTMYAAGASFSADVLSTGSSSQVQFKFHYEDANQSKSAGWSGAAGVVPVDPDLGSADVSLSSPWADSSWNVANWAGYKAPSSTVSAPWVSGLAWNGTAWNGTAWNGTAWNGTAWNGTAWNGTAWNGTAWNGAAWN